MLEFYGFLQTNTLGNEVKTGFTFGIPYFLVLAIGGIQVIVSCFSP